MSRLLRAPTLGAVLICLPSRMAAGEMKMEMKIDGSIPRLLRDKFGTYGFRRQQAIFPEADGALRFWLPAEKGTSQTGVYSYFALAGDCEVLLTYELLNVEPPQTGYGGGGGLAFDIDESGNGGRGEIQRVLRTGKQSGFYIYSGFADRKKKVNEKKDDFVPSTSKTGRIGLRRVKNELIFLKSDSAADELEEFCRFPFTDRTIRAVRFFADPGGSPTLVDIRLKQIEIRAEEITGGVPQKDVPHWSALWLLLLIPILGGGALVAWLGWRAYRRGSDGEEDEKPVARPKPRLKRS